MGNVEMQMTIRESRFFKYEIAGKIGISEVAFSQWFRKELTEEKKAKIINAIKELKRG